MKTKRMLLLFTAVFVSCAAFAQTYEDGIRSGVKDAETLKAQQLDVYPALLGAGHFYLEKRLIDPMEPGYLGGVIPSTDPCSNRDKGCTYAVKYVGLDASEINIALWGKPAVVSRVAYLTSRMNESDYWSGVYNGFYGRWFFSDF